MAERWTIPVAAEVIKAFVNGDRSPETVANANNIGNRFPLAAMLMAGAVNNSSTMAIFKSTPSYFSVRKLQSALKTGNPDATPEAEEDEQTEAEPPPVAVEKPTGRGRKVTPANPAVHVNTDAMSDIEAMLSSG